MSLKVPPNKIPVALNPHKNIRPPREEFFQSGNEMGKKGGAIPLRVLT